MGRLAVAIALTACNAMFTQAQTSQRASYDWRSDWAVRKGLALTRDASGFVLPTAIAFVPSPGKGPKDPLYFVAELHGTVKVVTNDRTVTTFARDFFRLDSVEAFGVFPSLELGMGGLCLDPATGSVFVTFVYHDGQKVLRNNIARFSTTPGTFSTTPKSSIFFTDIFASYPSAVSHQIGQCQVMDRRLFVGVGDGLLSRESQSLGSPLGKILRMTLDGAPAIGNPFFRNSDRNNVTNYIWAYGLRNPFGLRVIGDRLFAADNGLEIDRLVEVRRGHNYLWDGNDRSIATNAFLLLVPGRGVTHMDIENASIPLAGAGGRLKILQAVSGDTEKLSDEVRPQILEIEYDLDSRSAAAVPRAMVRYVGSRQQTLVGLAAGPGGIYFAGMFPDQSGATSVYRVEVSPDAKYPTLLENDQSPAVLMRDYGCFGCHSLYGTGSGRRGPVLDRDSLIPRLVERLTSARYRRMSAELDSSTIEPFVSTRRWRADVAATAGRDKLRVWIEYHVQEPKFDNPNPQMPNMAVTAEHAADIAEFLVSRDAAPPGVGAPSDDVPPNSDTREPPSRVITVLIALVAFVAGAVVSVVFRRFRR
jgi:hypothetical protein